MSNAKPSECTVCLPWGFSEASDNARKKHCTVCAGTGKVYAIPDTHRVVSVELLETLRDCAEDSPIRRELAVYESIRAIIDNKGQS